MRVGIYVAQTDERFEFALEERDDVYFQGGGMHAGYALREADDFLPDPDGEWLGFSLAMDMYEGASHAGSYVDYGDDAEGVGDECPLKWAWALIAENDDELAYILRHFPREEWREGVLPDVCPACGLSQDAGFGSQGCEGCGT
jgi:hypothetical protein